ncbi:unnamed protein product, partial [Arabidopsis halleri]
VHKSIQFHETTIPFPTICVYFNDDHACLSNNGILIKYQSGYASYDEPHTPTLALLCQL